MTMIGPKPIEEFSDEEVETLEATAVETPMRVIAADGVLALLGPVETTGPHPGISPSFAIKTPDPLD